ncbi:UDP-N-acetylglucosamine--dolichyl-phosphate N-acetylglucosaminephosphotransferase-like [Corticium candelabrum]|uniref:UDP-N-acetylglucosamine--dolichyl-phosphate N-acetylglucosaminephosphotransferase-like n=1 Tax=Corticium candelabrum TaxID=121492 RepID=UPI002E25EE96|nr:UDP-N-acetylglucosamine--dolichyl-phosphate N-acetylglucosaminephosphotransferase-like [Corticium candelabrum]
MEGLVSVFLPVFVNLGLAVVAFLATFKLIRSISSNFVKAGLHGRDLNKTSREPVPEALGVIAGVVYLVMMFLFIPVPFFVHWWTRVGPDPHEKVLSFRTNTPICSSTLQNWMLIYLSTAETTG